MSSLSNDMSTDDVGNMADQINDATADLRAHNYALVLTVVNEMVSGTDPNDAVSLIALRTGEDEDYLRRLTMLAIREALDSN